MKTSDKGARKEEEPAVIKKIREGKKLAKQKRKQLLQLDDLDNVYEDVNKKRQAEAEDPNKWYINNVLSDGQIALLSKTLFGGSLTGTAIVSAGAIMGVVDAYAKAFNNPVDPAIIDIAETYGQTLLNGGLLFALFCSVVLGGLKTVERPQLLEKPGVQSKQYQDIGEL